MVVCASVCMYACVLEGKTLFIGRHKQLVQAVCITQSSGWGAGPNTGPCFWKHISRYILKQFHLMLFISIKIVMQLLALKILTFHEFNSKITTFSPTSTEPAK